MKNSLLFVSWLVFLLFQTAVSNCQTVLLSEDFSGFTTGSHSTPSTNDLSLSLDSKTTIPGWHGSLIYSAGGEIKVGTASTPGWIETPLLDMSLNDGNCKLSFDIARWPGDASTVQVCVDGVPSGPVITPQDTYTRIEIDITTGTSASKIRLQAVTKRFFLDNFIITADVSTHAVLTQRTENEIKIWPVPTSDELHIENASGFDKAIIMDLSGKTRKLITINGRGHFIADISTLEPGFYLFVLYSENSKQLRKIIKI